VITGTVAEPVGCAFALSTPGLAGSAGGTASPLAIWERALVCDVDHQTGCLSNEQEFHMDREHIKGTAKKVEGSIKETVGKVTGNKEKEAEGKLDKAEGAAHKIAGDIKDAVRHGTE
jgi:uncharacterized protein YjbJ (UPF0337 family)